MHQEFVARTSVVIGLITSALVVACAPTVRLQPDVRRDDETSVVAPRASGSLANEPAFHNGDRVDEPAAFGHELARDTLVAEVLRRNPSIDAARQAWKAAVARPAQVGAFDDPMFSYSFAPRSIDSDKVDYGENAELSQRLPWPGKLGLKSEAASNEADAKFQDLEESKLRVALKAAALFDDYYLVARALELNGEHVRLLEELKRSATAQYGAGTLSQQDPIQAEVELAHLAHQDVVLNAERRVVAARINALLHRVPGAALPPPPKRLDPGEHLHELIDLSPAGVARLEEAAVAHRPEIASVDADIRARTADVALAGLEGLPDFSVMGQYNSMWGDEEHRWMAGVSVNLPIWRERIRAAQAEADARLTVARRQRQAMEDLVRSELRQSYERIIEAHHVLELYESRLLPAATDQLRVSRAGLESGRTNFMSLIDAERNLRDVQLGYEEALTALDKRTAELSRQLGCLPAELMAVLDSFESGADGFAAADGGAR